MKRIYETILNEHFEKNDQMAFVSGPRQVGKTTLSKLYLEGSNHSKYLNWDNFAHRQDILAGSNAILWNLPMDAVLNQKPRIVFDEIHKFKDWKGYLKGFYDEYKSSLEILVTGSSKLDVFRRGGDSLMGRYFLYRVHPLSVGELLATDMPQNLTRAPSKISAQDFETLYQFGGFPEPFLKAEQRFSNRWQNLRKEQLLKEDIRELAQVQELALLEVLAELLKAQSGQLLSYSNLSTKVRVSDQTIRRWIKVLESFYYCFRIQPWSRNVSKSLLKEPKIYLWDWSIVMDKGQRNENFIACHLLKAVHFWNDVGMGNFELYFLRDKEKREVDFLITQDQNPWLMVEVKSSFKEPLSPNLKVFQEQIEAQHVLQVAFDLPYVEVDCFALKTPKIVSVTTFLSQLV